MTVGEELLTVLLTAGVFAVPFVELAASPLYRILLAS